MSNLLKLYEYYFTGTDVKVFLSDTVTGKSVYVDLLNGIGYDYNLSSIPVYTLGTGTPTFFSKGNSLGQGMMVVPFKDDQYLKAMLQYIFEEPYTISFPKESASLKSLSDEEYRSLASKRSKNNRGIVSIGTISRLFDIKIVLDNSTPFYDASPKIIVLKGCKMVGESLDVSSSQDKIIQQAYKFYFKEITRQQTA